MRLFKVKVEGIVVRMRVGARLVFQSKVALDSVVNRLE
jgi:hypothetical protein